MSLPALLEQRLRLPVVAAPMFLVSNPKLVLACCNSGIVGSFPALNQRDSSGFKDWLQEIDAGLDSASAPYAVNLIVHGSNPRLQADLAICVEHRVPIVITSLGAAKEVVDAVHSYGGLVFADVNSVGFARKAAATGVDGLVLVASGAGGHTGLTAGFAFVEEVRQFWDGPIALGGAISSGRAIRAAETLGAELAYLGTAFIACEESVADPAYKDMVVGASAEDILPSKGITGVTANWLQKSLIAAGYDPANMPEDKKPNFENTQDNSKAWKNVWSAGQGVGAVTAIEPVAQIVARLKAEYDFACTLPRFDMKE